MQINSKNFFLSKVPCTVQFQSWDDINVMIDIPESKQYLILNMFTFMGEGWYVDFSKSGDDYTVRCYEPGVKKEEIDPFEVYKDIYAYPCLRVREEPLSPITMSVEEKRK